MIHYYQYALHSHFTPENKIDDGLNVSNGMLMWSFHGIQFNCMWFGNCFWLKIRKHADFMLCGGMPYSTNFSIDFVFLQHSSKLHSTLFEKAAYSRYQNPYYILCICVNIFQISKTKGFWMIDYSFRSAFQSRWQRSSSSSSSNNSNLSQCDWRKEFQLNNDDEIQRVYTILHWHTNLRHYKRRKYNTNV